MWSPFHFANFTFVFEKQCQYSPSAQAVYTSLGILDRVNANTLPAGFGAASNYLHQIGFENHRCGKCISSALLSSLSM
jgi:hypothetical protein